MKKLNISSFIMMCLLVVSGMMFTACDDDIDTNQYIEDGVKLNVWGPCPVARGGELRFLGSGMNQVSAVVFPDGIEVTEISRVSNEEIRVTVPQEAVEGKLILRTSQGDKPTTTEITYLEPVSIDGISPMTVRPGDELTITGEYLNLMRGVIFADGVTVTELVSQSRNEIKVIVPAEAQTGRIGVTDLAMDKDGTERPDGIPNEIYADVEEVGELTVTLPAVAQVLDATNVKPGDVITVTGTDMDLVTSVLMPNDSIAEFTYADGSLAITVRPDAIDGQVRVLPASGVEVVVANLTMAVPTEPVADKTTGLQEGNQITITGENLDVVTNVTFPGMTEPTALDSQSATEIKVTMPAAAQSGDLMLNTASGKSVAMPIETLKPTFTSFAATSVGGGENLVINGTNLTLVASVTFTGGASVSTFSTQTESQLTLAVPTTGAESGMVTLVMANGETVETAEVTITSPNCAYLPTVPASFVVGSSVVLDVVNGSHLTGVTINDVAVQFWFDESANTLSIKIPSDITGTCTLKLTSDNGEMTYEINIVPTETTIWEGSFDLGNWANGMKDLAWGGYDFSGLEAGTVITVYFTQNEGADKWQIKLGRGSDWETLPDYYTAAGGDAFDLEAGQTVFSYTFGENDVDWIKNYNGLIFQGANLTLTKVTLSN